MNSPFEPGNVPADMKALPQWVCWRYEADGDRQRKVPYDARTRTRASVSDPETWCAFDIAVATYAAGGFDGVGFVFSQNDDYCGIDLDNCITADGNLTPLARTVVHVFQTYTEVSPSGRGLKLFLRGHKSAGRCRTRGPDGDHLEFFDHGRYFTVTGQRWAGAPTQVVRLQAQLDSLSGMLDGFDRQVNVSAGAQAVPGQEGATAAQAAAGQDDRVDRCLEALMSIERQDANDGSMRLFMACCRCVEHDLTDEQALLVIGRYAQERPFPQAWTNDDILTRLRDADRHAARGSARQSGRAPGPFDMAMSVCRDLELGHDACGRGWGRVTVDGRTESWRINSNGFKSWLDRAVFTRYGRPLSRVGWEQAVAQLEAKARYEAPQVPTACRLGRHEGKIYLDLCDERRRVIQIDADGWRIIDRGPIWFSRTDNMRPLPLPVPGGSIDELRTFINVDDAGFCLVAAWLLAALNPSGPFPVLVLTGEQGSSKSTTQKLLRSIVDPVAVPLRSTPPSERDLAVSASSSWILAFDNLPRLQPWLSDALCRVSTGGGLATRSLYTNDQEQVFDMQRPLILNGIADPATAADLLDRSIILVLPTIAPEARRTEQELFRNFEAAMPRILGALLESASAGISHLADVHIPADQRPRMLDFANWACACEHGLPWACGTFLRHYLANRQEGTSVALNDSLLAEVIVEVVKEPCSGTASQLLEQLNARTGGRNVNKAGWPKAANAFSRQIKQMAPVLRSSGIAVEFQRSGSCRRIFLTPCCAPAEAAVPSTGEQPEIVLTAPGLPSSEAAGPVEAVLEPAPVPQSETPPAAAGSVLLRYYPPHERYGTDDDEHDEPDSWCQVSTIVIGTDPAADTN